MDLTQLPGIKTEDNQAAIALGIIDGGSRYCLSLEKVINKTSITLLGIKHQRSDKHCPWQNGKIERLFGTFKQCLKRYTLSSNHLGAELSEFKTWYNYCRPHQGLKGKTPAEQHDQKTANSEGHGFYTRFWQGALTGFYLPPN